MADLRVIQSKTQAEKRKSLFRPFFILFPSLFPKESDLGGGALEALEEEDDVRVLLLVREV